MRIDVRKFLFMGLTHKKEQFFNDAQGLGVIQFIDQNGRGSLVLPADVHKTAAAIKVLRSLPVVEQEEVTGFDKADSVTNEVLDLRHSIEALEEEARVLRQEIARIEMFGHFDQEELRYVERESGRKMQFFCTKKDADLPATEEAEMIYVASDHGLDYFVALNTKPKSYEGMIEMHIERPLAELQSRKLQCAREIHNKEVLLKKLARYNEYLHEAFTDKMNSAHLEHAKQAVNPVIGDQLFSVEAWVSESRVDGVQDLARQYGVHIEEVAIEESDPVPTYLENSGTARIGEDLVHIYDTPGVGDKDPSAWVLWAFALFFAMILGDGGYGLIFLASFLFMKFKVKRPSPAVGRVMKLFGILSVSCVLWGVLTHSFFGMHFDIDSQVRDYSMVQNLAEKKAAYHMAVQDDVYKDWVTAFPKLSQVKDPHQFLALANVQQAGRTVYPMLDRFSDNIMIEFALLVGILHISLSFLRVLRSAWSGIGWIAFMAGCYLYFPSMLNATSMLHFVGGIDKAFAAQTGYELLLGGLGSAIFLAAIQSGLGAGLAEFMNLIQVFSDVLSYLRLYALGLAGSMLSATFNEIGGSMTLVAGVIVIMIGHIVNIVLGIMGGVIHGLRLNFLEWYHYSFEGGGKLFEPLKKQ